VDFTQRPANIANRLDCANGNAGNSASGTTIVRREWGWRRQALFLRFASIGRCGATQLAKITAAGNCSGYRKINKARRPSLPRVCAAT
jgi:hypothetical protein